MATRGRASSCSRNVRGRALRIGALVAACALASCGSAPVIGQDGPPRKAVPYVAHAIPPGVYVASGDRQKPMIDGLYPATVPNDPACCWMAPQARVQFMKKRNATYVDVTVYVLPDVPLFKKKPRSIRISVGDNLVSSCCLQLGATTLSLRLPDRYRAAAGPFALHIATSSFVPAKEGLNGDTRVLGVLLRKVENH